MGAAGLSEDHVEMGGGGERKEGGVTLHPIQGE